MKVKLFAAAGLLVCFGVAVQAAQAQEVCSRRTLVGTYAVQEKGSSTIIPSLGEVETAPSHWSALIAPYHVMGEVTFPPLGDGEGSVWVRNGTTNSGFTKLPLQIEINAINANCTGDFTVTVTLPPPPGETVPPTETIEGHFIVSVNGRDWYTIPTSASDPFLAWIGVGHRIGKGGNSAETCGPETAKGTYLLMADNIVASPAPPPAAYSDAILLRLNVSMGGELSGVLYEKFGPAPFNDSDVTGTMTVNADCTYSLEFKFKRGSTDVTAEMQGVFFNQGKGLYGVLGSGFPFSVVQGERMSP